MSSKTEIIIDGQNKGAILSINGVKGELKGLANYVGGPFGSALKDIGKYLSFGAALGGVTALGSLTKQAINTADELYMMSQRIGVSVESLSVLKYAAEQSDLSMESMQIGLKKLSTNLYDVSIGAGKDAAMVFNDLGISVLGANGKLRQADEVLLDVADRFAQMTDGTEKSALAVKLFGKSGLELIPFLNEGKAGISQLTDEAERLGLKLSTETGAAAEQFNDSLNTFTSMVTGLAYDSLPPLLEELNSFTQGVIDLNDAVQDFSGESIIQGISRAIGNFQTMGIDLDKITGIEELIREEIKKRKQIEEEEVKGPLQDILDQHRALYQMLHPNLDKHLEKVKAIKDEYAKIIETIAAGQPQSIFGLDEAIDGLQPMGHQIGGLDMTMATEQFFTPFDESLLNLSQHTSDMFGSMSNSASMFYQASGQKAKAWFAVHKAFSIAQGIINTYEGATKALAQGGFFGIAMAATVIAAGLAQVAMIASQQPSTSGGGGSRSAGGYSGGSSITPGRDQGTGNYNPGQSVTYNIIVQGNVVDHDKFARELVPSINRATADGVS